MWTSGEDSERDGSVLDHSRLPLRWRSATIRPRPSRPPSSSVTNTRFSSSAGEEAASRPSFFVHSVLPFVLRSDLSCPLSASWKSAPSDITGGNSSSAGALRFHTGRNGPRNDFGGLNQRRWSVE